QETVIDTGGNSAEAGFGGANLNMIPRDGGNRFSFHSVNMFTNEDLASGKVPDDLVARGSAAYSNSVKKVWDYGGGVGGPILRDKLWFYGSARAWGTQAYGANLYFNQSSVFYRYVPDLTRPAYSDSFIKDIGGRLNWRVNDKNTITTDV